MHTRKDLSTFDKFDIQRFLKSVKKGEGKASFGSDSSSLLKEKEEEKEWPRKGLLEKKDILYAPHVRNKKRKRRQPARSFALLSLPFMCVCQRCQMELSDTELAIFTEKHLLAKMSRKKK